MTRDRVIRYYEDLTRFWATYHNHKEVCSWGALVLYMLFAGIIVQIELPNAITISSKVVVSFFVIVVAGLLCRYVSNQLKMKDDGSAHVAAAFILLSGLIADDRTEDELKDYMRIGANEDPNAKWRLYLPEKLLTKSASVKPKSRGFEDATRHVIYSVLLPTVWVVNGRGRRLGV